MTAPTPTQHTQADVIAVRAHLVDEIQDLWDTTSRGKEAEAIAEWLLGNNYISPVLFAVLAGGEE